MVNKTLLYIEDDVILRDLFNRKFQGQNGLHIEFAENGKIGIEMMDRKQPDFLMTGLNMPVMNGFDVLEHAMKKGYKFPKIVLTNFEDKTNEIRSKEFGVDLYLIKKNYTAATLWPIICKYLNS